MTEETKSRTFRPSLNETELKMVCKALYHFKLEREREHIGGGNIHIVAKLLVNLLALLHGKVVGRRKYVHSGTEAITDEGMIYFKEVKPEWLKELE